MSVLDDPRVFFAAERTALAWTRTSLTLMAFGFAIEKLEHRTSVSYWIGIAFLIMGAVFAFLAGWQYQGVIKKLKPVEIPEGYSTQMAFMVNALVGLMSAALAAVLAFQG